MTLPDSFWISLGGIIVAATGFFNSVVGYFATKAATRAAIAAEAANAQGVANGAKLQEIHEATVTKQDSTLP